GSLDSCSCHDLPTSSPDSSLVPRPPPGSPWGLVATPHPTRLRSGAPRCALRKKVAPVLMRRAQAACASVNSGLHELASREMNRMTTQTPTAPARERFLTLQGTLNTRDLGGLPLAGGGHTRHGRLLRSDGLFGLTDDDIALLLALPLRTVVDLRGDKELEREPSRLLNRGGVDVRNIQVWGHIEAQDGRPADRYDITAFYRAALDHAGPAFAEAVTVL